MSHLRMSTLDDGNNGEKRVPRRFSRRVVDVLLLNVYASESHLCDADKLQLSAESVNRAFASLRKVFSKSESSTAFSLDDECASESPVQAVVEIKTSRSALLSKYLEDYRLMSENSLCKRMMKIARIRPIIFAAGQSWPIARDASESPHGSDFEEITDLLEKLKVYLSRRCRRLEMRPGGQSSISTQTSSPSPCDKGIQCSKRTEFLKVSPNLKFFSRSSLVMNVESEEKCSAEKQRRNSSTSLEYVASYRPEFPRRLRSFSSSAISGPRASPQRTRASRRRVSDRLKDSIRQTANEFLRYSNFVEDDLVSIRRHRNKSRHDDVLAMKKVLLEDYITEVKEIIHSESRRVEEEREARILESVKSRMDRDLPTTRRDSWCSLEDNRRRRGLSPCTSYESARCCLGEGDRLLSCEALVLCAGCSLRARKRIARVNSCASCGEEKVTKSSRSVDSGVQLDCPSSGDTGREDDTKAENNDELLCQRVENAVRKFTEELILCERRARHRSRSARRGLLLRHRRRSRTASPTTTTPDQSSSAGLNYPRNSSDDEEENITGISTPSLISLSDRSDSEELPS
ncbi:uncharacterized protein LOC103316481 [Nasonia vitripennis]|uniref:Uncharacterized protein n=1 Tax=Nasonia vitripennis TaxID=7425 RepID=A0A7M7LUI0_NASVI|nr:uncharacterized protein LOC103316481 [Nasonia vitripennis]XP_031784664.1 uncharacterized protein LOC103316481 [Nasonia vitripennis]